MTASRSTRTETRRAQARPARRPKSPPAPDGKSARGPKSGTLDRDVEALVNSISAIARRIGKLKAQARALGVFTGDRDLLTCPKCGLMEDVLIDGRLVTYHDRRDPRDTGLRFAESTTTEGRFTCPECGSTVELVAKEAAPEEPGHGEGGSDD